MEPMWVPESAVRAIHAELIREHGGLQGASREGALEAALARPRHAYTYAQSAPSLASLAASYGFALAKGQCFGDGNKRIALAIIDVFLQLNGSELIVGEENAVVTILALAAGDVSEAELAEWIAAHCQAV
jgi:death on curing protein